ncbi:hypothetical protein CDAR_256591 [Caerostris darwini]|uniref:Uncharacterized protein n=1 Tax=Caerostris darwini TaxID=1538125 RepID=A0AAV4UT28_9ARAC|nr:hypothetical protein CDAR_256591 [Caerostris darwini]
MQLSDYRSVRWFQKQRETLVVVLGKHSSEHVNSRSADRHPQTSVVFRCCPPQVNFNGYRFFQGKKFVFLLFESVFLRNRNRSFEFFRNFTAYSFNIRGEIVFQKCKQKFICNPQY